MPVSMIRDMLESPNIVFGKGIYVGRGEIGLHMQSMELAEALAELLITKVYRMSITTLGFMPKNAETNEMFFMALAEASGSRVADIRVGVSLNLLNPYALANETAYADAFLRTVGILKTLGYNVYVLPMTDNDPDRVARVCDLRRRANRENDLSEWNLGNVLASSGRAMGNYSFRERGLPLGEKQLDCSYIRSKLEQELWAAKGYDIQPDGSIAMMCLNSGAQSNTFGNIYENDARQVATYRAVATKMLKKILERDHSERIACEIHRNANMRFQPPRSDKPLVRRTS